MYERGTEDGVAGAEMNGGSPLRLSAAPVSRYRFSMKHRWLLLSGASAPQMSACQPLPNVCASAAPAFRPPMKLRPRPKTMEGKV
jgi:hypothetical protein